MKKSLYALLTLMLLGAVQPLWGGTVYVPQALNRNVRGSDFTTQIRVHNDSGERRGFTYLFIPAGTNGANIDRETEPVAMSVPPHATMRLDDVVPADARGMIEINADDEIAVTARLIGTSDNGDKTFGVELPVITSTNAIAPGRTAILQGLSRTDGRAVSDFFILNLSVVRNECAVEVFKRGGGRVVDQVLSVAPLSLAPFLDVLQALDLENAGDVSIAVTCTELSRPFALTHDLATAELLFITPAGQGSSRLDPFPSNQCPPDAALNLEGDFHVPQGRDERATFFVPTTPGQRFSRLTLTMEFTHGGWNRCSSCNHAVFWLNRTSQWAGNLFGYLNIFGPRKNFAKNTHNVDLPRGVIEGVQQGALFQEGETYSVEFVYDAANRFIETVVGVKGGQEIVRMQDRATVRDIVAKDNFMLVFGHTSFEHGLEVTTFNWRYSNLCFQIE